MASILKKRIAIDLVPIRPGKGGTGSGIWIYARELVGHLDRLDSQDLEIICLVNRQQVSAFADLRNLTCLCFPRVGETILFRMLWVHLMLPLFCLVRRVNVLHRLATETPLVCTAHRVTTVHDFYYEYLMENRSPEAIRLYERLEHAYFSRITKICFRFSRAVITVSETVREEACRRYPRAASRLYTIYHGGPPIRPPQTPPAEAADILCIAKFMEHKGQHFLIAAFEALLETHPELIGTLRLTLRGFQNDAEYFSRIQAKVASSPYADRIRLVPFRPEEGLEKVYRDAAVVVLLSDCEGFGLPVLEAQCFGIPVVCSDLPVLREVGGEGTLYVGRTDRDGVAEILHRLITDRPLRQKQIEKGYTNVRRFSWSVAAQETLTIYRKVVL